MLEFFLLFPRITLFLKQRNKNQHYFCIHVFQIYFADFPWGLRWQCDKQLSKDFSPLPFNNFANVHAIAQQLFSSTGMVSISTFQSGWVSHFDISKNNQDIKYSLLELEKTHFPNNYNKIHITNSSALCRMNSDDPYLLDTACQKTWIYCFDRNRITANHLQCHKTLDTLWKNHLVRRYELLYSTHWGISF